MMKSKIYQKLIASCLVLAIMAVMLVAVSYAWITLSSSPTVSGIQISIGGGNTIRIAPNLTETVDGKIYNYPGRFNETLNFNQYDEYDYLSSLEGLSPVSTADGLHWYLPSYYGINDPEVVSGEAQAGEIKPIEEFILDTNLEYANLTDVDKAVYGSYIYLDFWVVSPGADYELRVSRGDDASGSFLLELMNPTEVAGAENSDGYTLMETSGSIASSARIGFLVDHNVVTDDTMLYYSSTPGYSREYSKLKGNYQNQGEDIKYSSQYIFTIYEPNGDLHPYGENGTYTVTTPIAWNGGDAELADISDRLAVQLSNKWKDGENAEYYIEEIFQTAIAGRNFSDADEAKSYFYDEYLQGQVLPYVDKGSFVSSTSELYSNAVSGVVSKEALASNELSGATEDVCIAYLEKNVPQRVRMFIWVEGQDADCRGVKDVSFALNIELAGGKGKINGKTKQDEE